MSVVVLHGVTTRYGSGRHAVLALDHVDLEIPEAAVIGLVGESGSGKSTLARTLVGLAPISAGEILLDGVVLYSASRRVPRRARRGRRRLNMVFQDPYASLDPRMRIGESIAEGSRSQGRRDAGAKSVAALLEMVQLDSGYARLLPRQLSGGQRQRVALARALAAQPDVLIADEITSALDVSVQGAALNLIRDIQAETGISILFISHNLAVVRYLADRIAVMRNGRLVEQGSTAEVTERPQHPYTRELISAVPRIQGGQSEGKEQHA